MCLIYFGNKKYLYFEKKKYLFILCQKKSVYLFKLFILYFFISDMCSIFYLKYFWTNMRNKDLIVCLVPLCLF